MQAEKQKSQQNTKAAANLGATKPASAAKPSQNGKAASQQPQKPKKRISVGAVLVIFLIVVLIAAGVLVYLNVGGIRQMLVTFLQAGLPQEGETESITAAELEQWQRELDEKAADLDAESEKLKKKSKQLSDREKELKDRESELTVREQALASAEASVQQTQEAQDDLETTARIFEAMDPKVAATAISGLSSVDDMVALLRKIPSETAAAIVSNMEAKLATRVLSEMIK